MTNTYAVYTGVGKEKKVAGRIRQAARRCKEIISAIVTPWPGYVLVEVRAGDNAGIKSTRFEMPKNTRMVIEMVPGVIKIVGNGREAVPID